MPRKTKSEREEQRQTEEGRRNFLSDRYHLWKKSKLLWPLALSAFFIAVLVDKIWIASQYRILVWDGYVYLLNAKVFETGYTSLAYFELLRPPLFPYLISLIWRVTGESVAPIWLVNPILTVAAGALLCRWGTQMFNRTVGFFAAAFFLVVPLAFYWTNQILAHGVMIFFFVLAAYSLWKATNDAASGDDRRGNRYVYYALAGAAAGLASLSRYPALVILPVASIYIVLILFVKRRTRRIELVEIRWILIGFVLFAVVWVPWLAFNASLSSGNPFVSLQSALAAEQGGLAAPWYYYLVDIPSSFVLGIPGAILLLLGLASKRVRSNLAAYLLLMWIAAFLVLYSLDPLKIDRFISDWAAPMAIIMAVGLHTLISFFSKRRSYLKVLAIGFTLLWLFNLAFIGNQAGVQNAAFLTNYFESRGLAQTSAWLTANMNQTSLGASDLGPYFSWFTNRNFMPIDLIVSLSSSQEIPIEQEFAALHVSYVVVSREYQSASSLAPLQVTTMIGDFLIYHIPPLSGSA